MSEVKRYSFWPQIVHLPGGGGIRAEVHFKVEEDGLFVAHQDYARLKAEVERLRKAGDELLHEWSSGDEKEARNFMKALVIWRAAKEGKQSV